MSFGSIFGNIKAGLSGQGRNPFFKGTTTRNRAKQRRGGYAGGWGAIAFGNIVNAHSSAEDIVDEFALDREDARYGTAYADAYQEEYTEAMYQYEEMCEYYFAIIDELTAEYNECIAEAEELRQEAQALREEAETLRDDNVAWRMSVGRWNAFEVIFLVSEAKKCHYTQCTKTASLITISLVILYKNKGKQARNIVKYAQTRSL